MSAEHRPATIAVVKEHLDRHPRGGDKFFAITHRLVEGLFTETWYSTAAAKITQSELDPSITTYDTGLDTFTRRIERTSGVRGVSVLLSEVITFVDETIADHWPETAPLIRLPIADLIDWNLPRFEAVQFIPDDVHAVAAQAEQHTS